MSDTIINPSISGAAGASPISPVFSSNQFLESNLSIIRQRFPRVAGLLLECLSKPSQAEVVTTAEGEVVFFDGHCQDHQDKPVTAAEVWVDRYLRDEKFSTASGLLVYGFGAGYHLECLLQKTKAVIAVIEPSVEVFIAAIKARDLQKVLTGLSTLNIGTEFLPEGLPANCELLIRPQAQVVTPDYLPKVKSFIYEKRGFTALRPRIGVVGPLMGGTLPIMSYCTRGFASLNQLTREIDLSGFSSSFQEIRKLLKLDHCRNIAENNYAQLVSTVVLESLNENPVDILVCMAQAPLTPAVLQEVRRRGIITVLWFVEDYLRFTYWREMAKYYDYVFTIQKGECLDLIKSAGAGEVHYLPLAADPMIHRPLQLSVDEKDRWGSPLSFVGAGYYNRLQVFSGFANMPLKIWGTEWPDMKPFRDLVQESGRRLTPEEYIKIFNATDININLHSSTERGDVDPGGDFVNPRTFELASCSAFQLVDERTLLSEAFEPGKEVITFKNSAELKEKIAYYSDKPEERMRIAEAGRARVLREHTYEIRLKQMLGYIYGSKFEYLHSKQLSSPWNSMIRRADKHPELKSRCQEAFERGDMPRLESLVQGIVTGHGKLSDTEQKLLFLHHLTSQIVHMKKEEKKG